MTNPSVVPLNRRRQARVDHPIDLASCRAVGRAMSSSKRRSRSSFSVIATAMLQPGQKTTPGPWTGTRCRPRRALPEQLDRLHRHDASSDLRLEHQARARLRPMRGDWQTRPPDASSSAIRAEIAVERESTRCTIAGAIALPSHADPRTDVQARDHLSHPPSARHSASSAARRRHLSKVMPDDRERNGSVRHHAASGAGRLQKAASRAARGQQRSRSSSRARCRWTRRNENAPLRRACARVRDRAPHRDLGSTSSWSIGTPACPGAGRSSAARVPAQVTRRTRGARTSKSASHTHETSLPSAIRSFSTASTSSSECSSVSVRRISLAPAGFLTSRIDSSTSPIVRPSSPARPKAAALAARPGDDRARVRSTARGTAQPRRARCRRCRGRGSGGPYLALRADSVRNQVLNLWRRACRRGTICSAGDRRGGPSLIAVWAPVDPEVAEIDRVVDVRGTAAPAVLGVRCVLHLRHRHRRILDAEVGNRRPPAAEIGDVRGSSARSGSARRP